MVLVLVVSLQGLLLALCCSHQRTTPWALRDQSGACSMTIAAMVPILRGTIAVLIVAAAVAIARVRLGFHPV
jgi:hypothetical protein